MADYTDSYFLEFPNVSLNYRGRSTVSTEWLPIDTSYYPTKYTYHYFQFIFDNNSTGNYNATITITVNGVDTPHTISGAYMQIELDGIATRYKVSVAGNKNNSSGTLLLEWLSQRLYFDVDETTVPIIDILDISRTKISSISGYDQCVVRFITDIGLESWEVRATLPGVTPAHGVGLLVETDYNNIDYAGVKFNVYIDDEELTNGDNDYTISIFGQSVNGVWSDG